MEGSYSKISVKNSHSFCEFLFDNVYCNKDRVCCMLWFYKFRVRMDEKEETNGLLSSEIHGAVAK
jgi:hypothetical protein